MGGYFLMFVFIIQLGLTLIPARYRSYYYGQFYGQRKPVHSVDLASVLKTANH